MSVNIITSGGSITIGTGFGNTVIPGSALYFPSSFGAIGDGITDDTDALNDCFSTAGNGTVMFDQNKTYLISSQLTISSGVTIYGNGSTIKKDDEVKSTTATAIADGATVIPVADGSVFSVGDTVILLDGTGTYGGKAINETSSEILIDSIDGNNITLVSGIDLPSSGNLDGAGEYPAETVVLKVFDMIGGFNSSSLVTGYFYNIVFDGNRINNDSVYSWTSTRVISALGRGSIVRDCTFKEVSAECLFPSNDCLIDGNLFYNLNGSAIHISKATVTGADNQTYGKNRITNNIFIDVMEKATENGRFACITNSANSGKTIISNNTLDTCGAAFYGSGGSDSLTEYELFLTNNKVKNSVGTFSVNGSTLLTKNHIISGNIFDNCEWGSLYGDNIEEGKGVDNVSITGNTFVNVRLLVADCSNINIVGNTFINEDGHSYIDFFRFGFSTKSLINCSNSINVNISGNIFEDKSAVINEDILCAIQCQTSNSPRLKSDASTETYYYYSRNFTIKDNDFVGFAAAISDLGISTIGGYEPDVYNRIYAFIGWEFSNNTIIMRADSDAKWGILSGPGIVVKNNTIYADSNADCGIRALGVNDASGTGYSGTIYNDVNGAIVVNNTIYGANPSIKVGNTANALNGQNDYNCQVLNNIVTKAIQDDTGGNSTISGTVTLTIDESPIIKRPRENTEFY